MQDRISQHAMHERQSEQPLTTALLPIGQVVARLQAEYPDVSHSSLRFLEREGLVTPHRTPGGHRLFTPQDVDRVRAIKRWQEQRLSLGEIRDRLMTREANPGEKADGATGQRTPARRSSGSTRSPARR